MLSLLNTEIEKRFGSWIRRDHKIKKERMSEMEVAVRKWESGGENFRYIIIKIRMINGKTRWNFLK